MSFDDAIVQGTPRQVEAALLASLASLIGSSPKPRERSRFTPEGLEVDLLGYTMPPMTAEQHQQAVTLVDRSLMAMKPSDCLRLLAELKVLTMRQSAMTDEDQETQLLVYARELNAYPADVVRMVLSNQHKISSFWPTWMELQLRLELHAKHRKRLREALRAP